jgi:signal transduction histidine kinase
MLELVVAVLWAGAVAALLVVRRRSAGEALTRALMGAAVVSAWTVPAITGNPVVRVAAGVAAVIGLGAFFASYRRATPAERVRLQWLGWGVAMAAAVTAGAWLLHALLEWPPDVGAVALVASLFVPLALLLSAIDRLAVRADRLLVRTIEVGGVTLLIGTIYLVVVLGFGNAPNDSERRVLGLSMIAAIIGALCYGPARARLAEVANRRVYGERRAPDEALQTFGSRMSRAIPLDELLLQLAESLKKSMNLAAAEVWTGTAGVLELAAGIPDRRPPRVRMSTDEEQVIARAHVSGNAWAQVWLPALLDGHPDRTVRIAPMAHSGELLGLIVCARNAGSVQFTEEEERVLTELARQVALALHNSALDTALQASLDDLQVANEELRASRARIVAAADHSRRQIERNLHDGAQQHLVALAVKLGLARQLLDADPATVGSMLEELRADAQTTLTELRELAHGIYPPLLMDRGLPEALRAAANRATLATTVEVEVGRYTPEVEAAVYFCCLEAMQNAGKYAGDGARITIHAEQCGDELCFDVHDDGAGFEASGAAIAGHGFVNMQDRVGAIGGSIKVESAPGQGTRVSGRMPARPKD